MQLSLAIIACLTLVGLELWPSSQERSERGHSYALATAIVEFHKDQCYFISAVLIAALLLDRQAIGHYIGHTPPPLIDVLLPIPLFMNGLIPTTFTFSFIARYGRLSWHIIVLTMVTFILSTGSLATT